MPQTKIMEPQGVENPKKYILHVQHVQHVASHILVMGESGGRGVAQRHANVHSVLFRVRSTVLCFANWQLPFLGSLRCFFDSLGCDVACNRAKHLPPSSSCRHMQTDLPTSSQLGTHSMKPFMALPYNILEPFVRPATGQATQEALKY